MMDAAAAMQVFGELRRWVLNWSAIRTTRAKERKQAIQALGAALTTTQIYLGDLARGVAPAREREQQLAQLWANAAIAFEGVDEYVAPLLQLKSEAWARPELWLDKEKCLKAGITIEKISTLTRIYLRGKQSKRRRRRSS